MKKQINSAGTEPARVRPGASYPGGKILRKAHTRLAARRQHAPTKSGFTMPGSMKGG